MAAKNRDLARGGVGQGFFGIGASATNFEFVTTVGVVHCAMAEPKPPTQQPVGWPKTIAMLILFHLTYLILPLTFIVVSGGQAALRTPPTTRPLSHLRDRRSRCLYGRCSGRVTTRSAPPATCTLHCTQLGWASPTSAPRTSVVHGSGSKTSPCFHGCSPTSR